ncbi:serine/threonine-protein kinase PLK4-like [Oscarella lobularis]|uniref:serine/threonine-protein kinase PLK4-like n=1 Tax=Oscarella lobularis TaxID=121494 RepID=UPI0033132AB8
MGSQSIVTTRRIDCSVRRQSRGLMNGPMGNASEDYKILELVGKGGFANVYRARCKHNGQEVAIKMIDKKVMQTSGMVSRVRNEVEIHCQLKHPSIVELYHFFEDDQYVYLILEMCHNGELQRYLATKSTPFEEPEAALFLKHVIEGVQYLHSHDIVHRDLTLSNLFLTRDMQVKIGDFGLAAKLHVPNEKHYTMCGTPNFISPEIVTRQPHGLDTDVWSLGCMLYTFLIGKPPFDTEGVKSTLTKVATGDYVMPKHLSAEAQDLIGSMLRRDPSQRINLKAVLSHPFMSQVCSPPKSRSLHVLNDSGLATLTTTTQSRKPLHPMPVLLQSATSNLSSSSSLIEEERRRRQRRHWSPHTKASSWACSGDATSSVQQENETKKNRKKSFSEKCSPLNTLRLRPTLHRKPNLTVSITSDGFARLETIKRRRRQGDEYVDEIFQVSADGKQITVSSPESMEPERRFQYEDLPAKFWGKYVYLSRYVKLIQSKTTKVYYFSERAKCCLMENGDFEACFYDGAKVCCSHGASSRVHVIQSDGKQATFESTETLDRTGSVEMNELYRHTKECHAESKKIEVGMDAVALPTHRRFQVIVDTRLATENKTKSFPSPSEMSTRPISMHSSYAPSTVTNVSKPRYSSATHHSAPTPMRRRSSDQTITKSVLVRGVGRGSRLANRDILVEFNDHTQLQVHSSLKSFLFTDGTRKQSRYDMTSSEIPENIKTKLACLRTVVQQLQSTRPP